MTSNLLEIKNLSVSYGGVYALKDVDLTFGSGEFVAVIGPNASGKSTLLKSIIGIIDKDNVGVIQGKISTQNNSRANLQTNSQNNSRPNSQIAYMPQHNQIDRQFPVNVEDLVGMGFIRLNDNKKEFIDKAMVSLNLTDIAKSSLEGLSGGQLQRAFLARALTLIYLEKSPGIILLDEPLNEVDIPTSKIVVNELLKLKSEGNTIIMTTHDLEFAREYATRIVFLNKVVTGDVKRDRHGSTDNHFHLVDLKKCLEKTFSLPLAGEFSHLLGHHHMH